MLKLLHRVKGISTISNHTSTSISHSPSHLPSSLTNTLLSFTSHHEALRYFNRVSILLDPSKHPHLHVAIIHILTSSNSYTKATSITKHLFHQLQTTRKPRSACLTLFNALHDFHGSKFTSDVFGVLMIAFCELGLVEEALWVYRKVGSLPLLKACNALLHGLVKTERFDFVWEVYGDMLSRGFSPTVITYGTLMQCCCCQGDSVNARKVFDEMLEKGIEPTVVVYTILIRVFCNEGQMGDAEGVFGLMRESGVIPNLYTYMTLMDGYGKMADVKRVFELYSDMLMQGLHPNVVTFSTLIDILCKVGDLRAARNCFVIWQNLVLFLMHMLTIL